MFHPHFVICLPSSDGVSKAHRQLCHWPLTGAVGTGTLRLTSLPYLKARFGKHSCTLTFSLLASQHLPCPVYIEHTRRCKTLKLHDLSHGLPSLKNSKHVCARSLGRLDESRVTSRKSRLHCYAFSHLNICHALCTLSILEDAKRLSCMTCHTVSQALRTPSTSVQKVLVGWMHPESHPVNPVCIVLPSRISTSAMPCVR